MTHTWHAISNRNEIQYVATYAMDMLIENASEMIFMRTIEKLKILIIEPSHTKIARITSRLIWSSAKII